MYGEARGKRGGPFGGGRLEDASLRLIIVARGFLYQPSTWRRRRYYNLGPCRRGLVKRVYDRVRKGSCPFCHASSSFPPRDRIGLRRGKAFVYEARP